jgi:protein gp37
MPAAVRFLSCEPLLEAITLRPLRGHGNTLDWVIVGGESGPHARMCDTQWIRSIVQQCQATRTAVFVKQMGTRCRGYPGHDASIKGATMALWPADLQVRQWPDTAALRTQGTG